MLHSLTPSGQVAARISPGVAGRGRQGGSPSLRRVLDPVLAEHGVDALGRERRRGALCVVEADGPHGATLQLTAQGGLRISDVRVDAVPCEDATLGL